MQKDLQDQSPGLQSFLLRSFKKNAQIGAMKQD